MKTLTRDQARQFSIVELRRCCASLVIDLVRMTPLKRGTPFATDRIAELKRCRVSIARLSGE
jgi:hypothetical protein